MMMVYTFPSVQSKERETSLATRGGDYNYHLCRRRTSVTTSNRCPELSSSFLLVRGRVTTYTGFLSLRSLSIVR